MSQNRSNEEDSESEFEVTDDEYVILMETNEKECESWYYFIRKKGNERNLKYLHKQFQKIKWYVMDNLSVFELDLYNSVSSATAKEMTRVNLNAYSPHRKFDGKLEKIDFGFKNKDDDEDMICRVFDHLGYGQIEEYIDDEDLDEEDLEVTSQSGTEYETDEESDEDSNDTKNMKGIPPSILESKIF